MAWARLDDRFFSNPKIAALSKDGKLAHLQGICWCAGELTDGFIPTNQAKALAGTPRVLRELTPTLWEPQDGGYLIHDYLVYNPSRQEVMSLRQARSEAGSKGAAQRWQNDSAGHSNSHSNSMANSMPPYPYPDPNDPNTDQPTTDATDPTATPAVVEWVRKVGALSRDDQGELTELARQLPDEWVAEAIDETVTKARSAPWPFCRKILNRCIETQQPPRKRRQPRAVEGTARAGLLNKLENAGRHA